LNLLFEKPFSPFSGPSLLTRERLSRHTARLFEARPAGPLFFAAVPDPATAVHISDLACRLKLGHELTGRLLRPETLHVPLFRVREQDARDAGERAASLAMPAFKVVFDRVGSFRNGAFVLRGEQGTIGLEVLQQRLSDTFDARPGRARPFTPHVTLLRDSHRVEEHAVQPVEWTVQEVVLMQGRQRLARVPLGPGRELAQLALVR
jgi:RNA 2',3'-cyclic 3'-phosphodiesterase